MTIRRWQEEQAMGWEALEEPLRGTALVERDGERVKLDCEAAEQNLEAGRLRVRELRTKAAIDWRDAGQALPLEEIPAADFTPETGALSALVP